MTSRVFLMAGMVMLSACVAEGPDRMPPEPAPEGACGAPDLQDLVGRPEAVLATMKFGVTTRIIRPGMAVTMDYSPDRLNIWIGEDGRIESVTCG